MDGGNLWRGDTAEAGDAGVVLEVLEVLLLVSTPRVGSRPQSRRLLAGAGYSARLGYSLHMPLEGHQSYLQLNHLLFVWAGSFSCILIESLYASERVFLFYSCWLSVLPA